MSRKGKRRVREQLKQPEFTKKLTKAQKKKARRERREAMYYGPNKNHYSNDFWYPIDGVVYRIENIPDKYLGFALEYAQERSLETSGVVWVNEYGSFPCFSLAIKYRELRKVLEKRGFDQTRSFENTSQKTINYPYGSSKFVKQDILKLLQNTGRAPVTSFPR